MKKVLYIDMDGVINLFEHDPDARTNMWERGYFYDISPRENIGSDLVRLSGYFDEIVILTKCIRREGVEEEKGRFVERHLSHVDNLSMVFVPYDRSKADYIDPGCFTVLLDDGLKNIMECDEDGNPVETMFDHTGTRMCGQYGQGLIEVPVLVFSLNSHI